MNKTNNHQNRKIFMRQAKENPEKGAISHKRKRHRESWAWRNSCFPIYGVARAEKQYQPNWCTRKMGRFFLVWPISQMEHNSNGVFPEAKMEKAAAKTIGMKKRAGECLKNGYCLAHDSVNVFCIFIRKRRRRRMSECVCVQVHKFFLLFGKKEKLICMGWKML